MNQTANLNFEKYQTIFVITLMNICRMMSLLSFLFQAQPGSPRALESEQGHEELVLFILKTIVKSSVRVCQQ